MHSSLRKYLRRAALGVALAGSVYFVLTLLAPSFGKLVGYANTQPALQIIQPTNALPASAVRRTMELAEFHFKSRPHLEKLYWPQPSRIEEKPDCWLVVFTTKIPVYELWGLRHPLNPTDPAMYMSITKSNAHMTFGKWCK